MNTLSKRYIGLFFCVFVAIFALELALRVSNPAIDVLSIALLPIAATALATSAFLCLIVWFIPGRVVGVCILVVYMVLLLAYTVMECCVKDYFGNYFLLNYVAQMSGQVAGQFGDIAFSVVLSHIGLVIFALAVVVAFGVACAFLIPRHRDEKYLKYDRYRASAQALGSHAASHFADETPVTPSRLKSALAKPWVWFLSALVVFSAASAILCRTTADASFYTTNYSANNAMVRYGMVTTIRLEAQYTIFGQPEEELGSDVSLSADGTLSDSLVPDRAIITEEAVYGENILNINFSGLAASTSNSTLKAMDEYFGSQTPTSENEYTGMFKGKNLIVFCAEAFSYAIIDPELTPALYQLTTTGFVIENYYQPDWSQSTTGGEFAVMTGIIPTWVNNNTSFYASRNNAMPLAMGWVFRSIGYSALAYHNNYYNYYNRDLTHPNLGYDYYGLYGGLDLPYTWPCSDLDMLEATVPQVLDDYLETGTPFHLYYMTVSGHSGYSWTGNTMSYKNREAVLGLNYSDTVLAYIAAQLELEYALEYLLAELEEAGLLEDTVIVLSADHYPYALSENYDQDYYVELTGIDDNVYETSRYKNSLILWCGSIEEPIYVDTPCTSVDIVPTLYNLFGIDYDSRLFSGRDILAPDVEIGQVDSSMHIAVIYNFDYGYSWITAAGTYESLTKTFTPAEGVVLADEAAYVEAVSSIVANRFTYAKYIISQDYYAHVFPNWTKGALLKDSL